MNIVAQSKYIRVSPRKMQLLVRDLENLSPSVVLKKLEFTHKSGTEALKKLIISVLNNAKQHANFSISDAELKSFEVFPAGAMKRFHAVSRGMAHEYKKRMSHIRVVLTDEKVTNSKPQIPNTKQISTTKNSK